MAIVVRFDETWKTYSADGVWLELKHSDDPEPLGLDTYSQCWYIDAREVLLSGESYRINTITSWHPKDVDMTWKKRRGHFLPQMVSSCVGLQLRHMLTTGSTTPQEL